MPPKRKAQAATKPSTTTTSRGTEIKNTAAKSRPRRESTLPEPEERATKKAKTAIEPNSTTAPKKRGRPSKPAEPAEEVEEEEGAAPLTAAPKKRGRPSTKSVEPAEEDDGEEEKLAAPAQPKKRGRPGKAKETAPEVEPEEDVAEEDEEAAPIANKQTAKQTVAAHMRDVKNQKATKQKANQEAKQTSINTAAAHMRAGRNRGQPTNNVEEDPEPNMKESKPVAKKRGRPSAAPEEEANEQDEPDPPTKKGRGRPKAATKAAADDDAEKILPPPAAKKRGRPANNIEAKEAAAEQAKKRGRPASKKKRVEPMPGDATEQLEEELAEAAATPGPQNKRKAPAASKGKGRKAKKDDEEDGEEEVDTSNEVNPTEATTELAVDADEDGRQYWLLKAEPDSRMETNANGEKVDVKFSIDDLQAKTEPEPWEGIRNLTAQKNMRTMKTGDLAFFYASNTKTPGIVGIMEIVQEFSPDGSAFDKSSPYFDAKSDPKRPKWNLVHVAFRRKFPEIVSLTDLKKYGKSGGALENMQTIKSSRLSVSKVSLAEWTFIMSLVDDDSQPADFAAAFEAPVDMVDNVEAVVEDAMSDAGNFANAIYTNGMEVTEALTDDVVSRTAFSPTIEEPSAIPSSETAGGPSSDAFISNSNGGFFDSVRAAFGSKTATPRASSRAAPAKPSSRAGSRTRKTASRAGSAVPTSSAVPESIAEEEMFETLEQDG